jgi:enamine deaminase RidA (YjgF/YER057c/UK114 family)
MEMQSRRGLLKNAAAAAVAVTGAAALAPEAKAQSASWEKKTVQRAPTAPRAGTAPAAPAAAPAAPAKPPMFSGIITAGPLVFIAGIGAHFPGTIQEHTKHVLDELEQNLTRAGSSMAKVCKVNVYISKADDFAGMNEMFQGRFGAMPPVRTTIAAAWIPGDSLVEIDCIATL